MKKFIIVALSIVIFFGVGELLVWALYPQSQYSVTYAPWGWRHIPNTTVTFYGEKPDWRWKLKPAVKIQYDKNGIRSYGWGHESVMSKKIMGRILCLGDSFLEDMGSPFANTVPVILQKRITWNNEGKMEGVNGRVWEFINAGHYGFCNAQELMYYIDEGEKFNADIVLIFYAQDTANPTYAELNDWGYLNLKFKTFTIEQKLYKNIVSFIRLHSQFGSFILNRLERISFVNKVVIQKGLNEHIPVTNLATAQIGYGDFAPIDKEIWRQFKYLTKKNGSKLIIMNCMGNFTPQQNKFFDREGILHFGITGLPIGDTIREYDKLGGAYTPSEESHRFGYRNNKGVAERIYQFLKEKNLL